MNYARASTLSIALAIAGCGHLPWVTPEPPTPARANVQVPEQYSVNNTGEDRAIDRWWTSFGDDHLNQLLDEGLAANFGLRQAWARLAQADAVLSRTGAARWPEITGGIEQASTSSVFFAGDDLGGQREFRSDQLLGIFAATWEVDLWNRIGSQSNAATNDLEATRDDVEALAMILAAEITDTWVTLVEAKAQLRLLSAQHEVSDQLRELVDLRFAHGLASAPDVLRQKQQVASIAAQIPQVKTIIAVLELRLAVLLGRPPVPATINTGSHLPEPLVLPTIGLPVTLLRQRPDVRAAERRVAAADHRVAAAIADRFPAIRLSGRTGWQGFETASLPDNWIWTVAGNLVTPLFDAGRRRSEVDRTRAVLEERLAAYGEAVLRAVEEVEAALTGEALKREHIKRLASQTHLARAALQEIRNRYTNGLTDYLDVLTALASLQTLERKELTAKRELLSFQIQIHRALGGSWTRKLPGLRAVREKETNEN